MSLHLADSPAVQRHSVVQFNVTDQPVSAQQGSIAALGTQSTTSMPQRLTGQLAALGTASPRSLSEHRPRPSTAEANMTLPCTSSCHTAHLTQLSSGRLNWLTVIRSQEKTIQSMAPCHKAAQTRLNLTPRCGMYHTSPSAAHACLLSVEEATHSTHHSLGDRSLDGLRPSHRWWIPLASHHRQMRRYSPCGGVYDAGECCCQQRARGSIPRGGWVLWRHICRWCSVRCSQAGASGGPLTRC